ncbi:MAG: hypothetical protein ONA90_10035 [candidate division KSB1 bacterium]|nr:hypothetical protein [candidate division KSB1 bacterium]
MILQSKNDDTWQSFAGRHGNISKAKIESQYHSFGMDFLGEYVFIWLRRRVMFVPYFYTEIKCPYCKAGIDMWLLGLNSGLGPPLLACGKCGQIVQTGRRESSKMQQRQRGRYYLISTLYVALAVFFGGVLTKMVLVGVQYGMDAPVSPNLKDPFFCRLRAFGVGWL